MRYLSGLSLVEWNFVDRTTGKEETTYELIEIHYATPEQTAHAIKRKARSKWRKREISVEYVRKSNLPLGNIEELNLFPKFVVEVTKTGGVHPQRKRKSKPPG